MTDKDNSRLPSYYTVIPAFVRYNRNLSNFDKLLYGEIIALTNSNGYCWATNKYFAKVFSCVERTITRSMTRLLAHTDIQAHQNEKTSYKRVLTLKTGLDKNVQATLDKNVHPRARPKSYKKNNTRSNTLDTNVDWFDDYLKKTEKELSDNN